MRAYIRFCVRHRIALLVLCGVITAMAGWMCTKGILGSSVSRLFLGESPAYQRYVKRIAQFGSDEIIILAIEDPALLTPQGLDRLRGATQRLEALPEVRDVASLVGANRIIPTPDGIEVVRYLDDATDDPAGIEALRGDLAKDAFVGGLLVSAEGRHASFIVELSHSEDRSAEEGPGLVEAAVSALADAGYPRDSIHRSGFVSLLAELVSQTRFNLNMLFPLVLLLLLGTVYLLFRRLWPVLITGVVSLLSVIWTMGFAIALDPVVSVMMAMAPAVILIVSFSDVVHLSSAYLLELADGSSKDEAVLNSGTDVGQACLLTSITTALGFLSMALVPTPIFRRMGLVFGFGVGVALLLAMTLGPVAFSLMPQPKPWRLGATSRTQRLVDGLLNAAARLATARPRAVVAGFAAVLALSAVGIGQLHVETRFAERLRPDNPIRRGNAFLEEHFAGTTTMDIFIDTEQPGGLLDPEVFARIAAYQSEVAALEGVDDVASLVDLVRTLHEALAPPGQGPALPSTREALAQYLLLFEMSGDGDTASDLERLVSFDRRSMRLSARLSEDGVIAANEIANRAASLAEARLGPGVKAEPTGLIPLMGGWLDEILVGQRRGLLAALVMIAVMMMIGLRSVRVGLWSMVPNVLPLLMLGGYLGLTWDEVDSDVFAIAMTAIGIGVDDTIHFLMRLRIESERAQSRTDAIHRTFHYSGRGIVMTTVILVAGFLPFALSGYLGVRIMGTLLPFTLAAALLADLLLVPALTELGWISFKRKRGKGDARNKLR